MKVIAGVIAVVFVFASCSKKTETDSSQNVSSTAGEPNTLSAEQINAGWKLLFDGKTMNGWRTFKDKENDTWEVTEGTLHCKAPGDSTATKRADIMTVDEFENFELVFDWKIAPTHNSGVMYRVTEEYDVPYGTGPEYQIIDEQGYPGKLKPGQLVAADYDMYTAAEDKPLNPAGEWNSSRILVNGAHVEHWLNERKVVEYELWSDDWKKRVSESKWKEFPRYGLPTKGHIDFQDHGGEVWFRNVMIKVM